MYRIKNMELCLNFNDCLVSFQKYGLGIAKRAPTVANIKKLNQPPRETFYCKFFADDSAFLHIYSIHKMELILSENLI